MLAGRRVLEIQDGSEHALGEIPSFERGTLLEERQEPKHPTGSLLTARSARRFTPDINGIEDVVGPAHGNGTRWRGRD